MKILNNLRWKHYMITAVLIVVVCITLLCLSHPLGTDSSGSDKSTVETTTTTTTGTTSTTTKATTTKKVTPTTTTVDNTTTTVESTTAEVVNENTQVSEGSSPIISESVEEVEENISEPTVPEYVVYKPGTHYIHKNTCRWADGSCYEISTTEGLECRYCTECRPDMEIITFYEEPQISTSVSNEDFVYLCRIVYHEAGSYWISEYDKARVAAGVMNRVYDARFPNSVLGVLTQKNQFSGFNAYTDLSRCENYQASVDAVNAYLANPGAYGSHNSWWGDGRQNHFYTI